MKHFKYIGIFAIALAVAACSSDDDISAPSAQNSSRLAFQTNLQNTRATMIDNISSLDSLYLTGWQYNDSASFYKTYAQASFFYMDTVKVESDGSFATKYNWPNNDKLMSFFAFGPKDIKSHGLTTITPSSTQGTFEIGFEVPETRKPEDMGDLIVGTVFNHSTNGTGKLPITLKHALTAVQFVVGDDSKAGVRWKSISLSNVVYSGTYNMLTGWRLTGSGVRTYSIDPDVVTNQKGYVFVGGDTPWLLIPQTLSSAARITVDYQDGDNTEDEKVFEINQKEWEPGKIVTYYLTFSSHYGLQLSSTVEDWALGDKINLDATVPPQSTESSTQQTAEQE